MMLLEQLLKLCPSTSPEISSKYIRSVLNTNPQLTNTTTIASADLKSYWLGESFVDHLDTNVDLAAATGTAYAILMPLGVDDTAAKTGDIINMVPVKQNLAGYSLTVLQMSKNYFVLNHCIAEKIFKEII